MRRRVQIDTFVRNWVSKATQGTPKGVPRDPQGTPWGPQGAQVQEKESQVGAKIAKGTPKPVQGQPKQAKRTNYTAGPKDFDGSVLALAIPLPP